MRMILVLLMSFFIAPALVAGNDPRHTLSMPALEEDELSGISGTQGVVLEIKLYNNIDPVTLAPLNCLPSVGNPNACRMGLEFAARSGNWLMLKEFFGSLHLKDIRMDAGFTPATNTSYYNPARFKDVLGNNLIPGANPLSSPVILMQYPATDAQGTYDDLLTYLNVSRAWLEYDQGATPGYNRDTSLNSALSIRMADSAGGGLVPDPDNPPDVKLSNHAPAKMRFWGTAYVYGF
jgi:hypothetical protein